MLSYVLTPAEIVLKTGEQAKVTITIYHLSSEWTSLFLLIVPLAFVNFLEMECDPICSQLFRLQSEYISVEMFFFCLSIYDKANTEVGMLVRYSLYASLYLMFLTVSKLNKKISNKITPNTLPWSRLFKAIEFIEQCALICCLVCYFCNFHYRHIFLMWRSLLNGIFLLPNLYSHIWVGKRRCGVSEAIFVSGYLYLWVIHL